MSAARDLIVDLFAGPGGWSEGLRMLGLADVGIEWDDAACRTRAAAGHLTVRADVAQYPPEVFAGKVEGLIASPPCQDFSLAGKQAGRTGEKGQLIDTVPVWVDALRPRWVACEQVPPALEVWEEFARLFRSWGYSAWCGVLNAADYGVPQTRKRAFLLASLDGPALPPEPTHARNPEPGLFGTAVPWVTMAQALGWNDGRVMNKWMGEGMVERHGERPDRTMDEPAFTVTGASTRTVRWLRTGNNSMVTGRTGSKAGDGDVQPYERSVDEPAPTLDTMSGAKWTLHPGAWCHHEDGSQSKGAVSSEDVRSWAYDRPATTIVGSFSPDTVAAPGYRKAGDPPRQDTPGSIKITLTEALVLQSFPADYPVQGTKTKGFEQVGNAVPPLLAAHIVAALTGSSMEAAA